MIASRRKDEALERLSNGIAQLTSSDAWSTWLRTQARFHHYSFSNSLLILVQRPSATRVAGFHTWRRLGRIVRRGERAIWILAPVTRQVAETDSSTPDATKRVIATFRPVPVFDAEQTEGKPLPEVCNLLAGDDPYGAYSGLVTIAESIGFTVQDHVFDGETNGDCTPQLQRIRVEVNLAPAHRVKTLAHELGHALLHVDVADRGLNELEAESVA
jgi:antirestriction protein ArdC